MIRMKGDNVLLLRVEPEETTKSGLIIPRLEKTKHLLHARTATVVSVGDKVKGISPGDVVYYEKMLDAEEKLFEYEYKDKRYMILKEKQIYAKRTGG